VVVGDRELDALLELLDSILDVPGLARVEPAAGALVQAAFDAIGLVAQAVGRPVADPVAAIEARDLALDIVDPLLKFANLAPITPEAIVMAVVVAIGRGLRSGIILRGGGAGGGQSGTRGGD
jgi:hypothetical protein